MASDQFDRAHDPVGRNPANAGNAEFLGNVFGGDSAWRDPGSSRIVLEQAVSV